MWSTSVPVDHERAAHDRQSGNSKPVTLDLPGLDGGAFQIDSSNGSGHYLKQRRHCELHGLWQSP